MKKIFVSLFCTILFLLIFACRAPIMENSSALSSITLTLPQTFLTNLSLVTSERAIMNTSVGTISLEVTAKNMDTVTSYFSLSKGSYTASVTIPQGTDRTFTITATDGDSTTYAKGTTTVDVSNTTQSIELTLKPIETDDANITVSFSDDFLTSFCFMSSDEDSDNTQITEDKVYVFPFAFDFTDEINSLGELSLNIVDSDSEDGTIISTETNTWTPTSEDDVYYILLTKTETMYYFCLTQEDGTELVKWEEEVFEEDSSEDGFYKETYNLQITNKDTNLIDFEIQSATSLEETTEEVSLSNLSCQYIEGVFILTWNTDSDASSFEITNDDGTTILKTSTSSQTTITTTEITNLNASTEYTFKIRAIDSDSTSEWVEFPKNTITLNSNNDSVTTSTISLYEGQTVSSANLTPAETWTEENCYFAGWTTSIMGYTDAITYGYDSDTDNDGTIDNETYPSTTMPSEDQTFYAIWMPDYLTVDAGIYIYATSKDTDTYVAIPSDSTYALVVTGSDYDSASSIIGTTDESITIPEGVTAISGTDPENITSQFSALFSGGFQSLSTITLPKSLKAIGVNAFESCSTLTTITIPDNVSTIGESAFMTCSTLKSITIPSTVTKIEAYTFNYCEALNKVTIPSTVTSIGAYAFESCGMNEGTFAITLEPTTPPSIEEYSLPSSADFLTIEIPSGYEWLYANTWSDYSDYIDTTDCQAVTISIADYYDGDTNEGLIPLISTGGEVTLTVSSNTNGDFITNFIIYTVDDTVTDNTGDSLTPDYESSVTLYVPTESSDFTITAYDADNTKYASGTATVDITTTTTEVSIIMSMIDTTTLLESNSNDPVYSIFETDISGVAFSFDAEDVGKVFIYEFSPTITEDTDFQAQYWDIDPDLSIYYDFYGVDLVVLDSDGTIVSIDDQTWTMSQDESVYLVFTPTNEDGSLAVTFSPEV